MNLQLPITPTTVPCGQPASQDPWQFVHSTAAATPVAPPETLSVLHVINGEHFSGAERVQQLLGERLPEFGVRAEFACLKPGKFPTHCGLASDRIHLHPMQSRFDLRGVRQLKELVQQRGFQLLHAHTPRAALITSLVAKQLDLPWVYHVHSPAARDSTRRLLNTVNEWMEWWSLRHCSKIITVSRSLRRELLRAGWSRHRVVTVANGVAEQTPIDPLSRQSQTHWKLGMIALFRPRKGIEVLLNALAILQREKTLDKLGATLELQVIGGFETAHYETEIRQLVDRLDIGSMIQWTGFVRDVPAEMRKLDAMVLPSLFGEGMPMVVLEALAMGVPVVATRVEGTPEVVRHQVEGLLADPQDSESLAKAITTLISDRQTWLQMSQQAVLRHRQRYTDHEMARHTSQVYRSMM